MIDKTRDVLGYLIVTRCLSLLSKAVFEPMLKKRGYTEADIEQIVLSIEVIEIALLLVILKR